MLKLGVVFNHSKTRLEYDSYMLYGVGINRVKLNRIRDLEAWVGHIRMMNLGKELFIQLAMSCTET